MDAPTAIALRREPGPLARSLTALLLRLGLGMIFLMAGLGKFNEIAEGRRADIEPQRKAQLYPQTVRGMFHDSSLEEVLPGSVATFTRILPYAEVSLGAALILGVLTSLTAFLTGILILNLLLGWLVIQKADMYPSMLTYLLADAVILWLSPVTSNYLSLDGLLFGWFRRRPLGEYARTEPVGR